MFNRRKFLLGSTVLAAGALSANAFAGFTTTTEQSIKGPSAPIEIVEDRFGIPHIRAKSISDAYFGQGYVVARDRLFQIDFSHRRELGRLAEDFGPRFVAFDARARLFKYRGDLAAERAKVPAHIFDCAAAYVAGINARVDEVLADPSLLPLEYRILNITPLKWDVMDYLLYRGSEGNAADEVRRAKLAALDALELDAIISPLRPTWDLKVPEGLDTKAVSDADLGVLRLGRLPFDREPTVKDPAGSNAGSNAWTVSPLRTATGRPILANDPHLGIGGFGPRYLVHMTAPGLDVIGAGAPGSPGIMQGHTDRFAFGRTNFHIDQGDLFILTLNPADPEEYRHEGVWKKFQIFEETVGVKDQPAQTVKLRYSVHGPVVSHDPSRNRATAHASVSMQPGGFGGFAMIAINLSKDWETLKTAFLLHPSPTNLHYADIDGNTGWQVIGRMPIRKKGEGLMPVPGDGAYDWVGLRTFKDLPSEYNSAKGWFASANQNNLPADWPRDRIPAFSFREPYRYERIADVLAKQPKHTIQDSVDLMHDTFSIPASKFLTLLPKKPSKDAQAAVEMLRKWDAKLDAGSNAAVLYQTVWRDLTKRMLDIVVPAKAKHLVDEITPSVLLTFIEKPDARMGAKPVAVRDKVLNDALVTGWSEAKRLLGNDPAAWRYGDLHQVKIRHPLSVFPAIAAAFPTIEGGGSGGDGYTPMARWLGSGPGWNVGGGASYLQAIDVGNWDNSVYLFLAGQSNDPRSPHYQDHYQPWIEGKANPLLFTPRAVEANAARRLTLNPTR